MIHPRTGEWELKGVLMQADIPGGYRTWRWLLTISDEDPFYDGTKGFRWAGAADAGGPRSGGAEGISESSNARGVQAQPFSTMPTLSS
jgi:hypothetical protein